MSFPPLPLLSRALTPNPTINRTSATGRVPYLNARLNTSCYSVTSPGASITTPTSPSPSSSKPRQKSKVQSRPKTHHVNTADSRSKSKAKAESRPKGSKLRMRVKRDILIEAPDAAISDLTLRSEATSAEDLKDGQNVDEYPDGTPSTEDDETEGEAEAETDRDTEAEADTSVEADASHRTLIVDPFSAEEERIITVLSRKLEQLRESETTISNPLSLVASPPLPLPSSTTIDPIAGVPVVAAKQNGGRSGVDSSQPVVTAAKDKAQEQNQKRISSTPTTTTTIVSTLDGGATNCYPPARVSSHSRTSSVDSGIYALPPSPVPSSPSSVYAAPVASPINYRNGSTNGNSSARSNNKTRSNDHAVPIAVNGSATSNGHTKGKDIHHDDGIPIDFDNTSNRTYGAHISTLSSPEMSLSASPCETYDTRWMGTKVNPNGIGFAVSNGNTSFPSNNGNGRARLDGLQTALVPNYEQESENKTQTQLMLHALMQENEQLKSRMAEMEGNYLRLASLNEVYRVELIDYRSRLGLSVDNLIGLASDPVPESLPPPTRFTTTSRYTHTQSPHTYHHQQRPSSPKGNTFNNHTSYNNINSDGNNQYHHSYTALAASSLSNSTSVLNPLSSATTRHNHHRSGSYMSSSSRIANGFRYENGHNNTNENGFGTNSTSHLPRDTSATSKNGVPIPRPPSQVHTNRMKQSPMTTIPMSVPNSDNPLLYMHGSTSRSVNETRVLSTSPSYSSLPYSNNSPALLSPSYSSSYSAASSSAASSSAASSASTNVTSPPSSLSFTMMMMLPPTFGVPSRGLTYPLVPPPSLSSSLGSGSGVWDGAGGPSGNLSPVDTPGPSAVSRRGSNAGMSVGRRGSFSSGAAAGSTGRVMDTGSLRRSRGGSLNHGSGYISRPETVDETEGDHEDSSKSQGLAGIREP